MGFRTFVQVILWGCWLSGWSFGAVFDFAASGSSASPNNSQMNGSGNAHVANAEEANQNFAVSGITLTVSAVSASGSATIGANDQGFGVSTNGESSTSGTRIEAQKGEGLRISFDTDATLDSLRLGNFQSGEVVTISFHSGTNPFVSGSSLTITGNGLQGPSTDIPLTANAIVSGGLGTIRAGTILSITMSSGGALLNELTVSEVEENSLGNLRATKILEFPQQIIVSNPTAGSSPGNATISSVGAQGQSFSLSAPASVTGFVFKVGGAILPTSYTLQVARAMDDRPWASAVFMDSGNLPSQVVGSGGLIQINLPAPLLLSRGSWTVTLAGLNGSFQLVTSETAQYTEGSLIRMDASTQSRWDRAVNRNADLVFGVIGQLQSLQAPPAGRPNIIFILVDDLGWTDIQTGSTGPNVIRGINYGSDYYQTPNLARLAASGLSFTQCHMNPNCAPTRAALLSGKYAPRSGNGVYNVGDLSRGGGSNTFLLPPSQNEDVPASTLTHAEALASAGYINAHFGKYHVGGHEGGSATLPLNQGFEMNFGGSSAGNASSYFSSSSTFNGSVGPEMDLWAEDFNQSYINTILKGPAMRPLHTRALVANNPDLILSDFSNPQGASKHLDAAMADAAIAFLNDHHHGALKNHPFFMQFHFYSVHTPVQPRWDLYRKYMGITAGVHHNSPKFAALIEGMDQTMGRIMDWVEDPNGDGDLTDCIAGNTLIVFTSDNGGHEGDTDNWPLRSRKGSFWEGGLRVPLIVSQPGVIPAATTTDTLVHAVDFYPTLLEHAGVSLPPFNTLDGVSFAKHMKNPAGIPRDRGAIFYHFPGYLDNRARPCSVMIKRIEGEDYKLIYNYDIGYGSNSETEDLKVLSEPWELYHLSRDMSETRDLIDGSYSNQLLYGSIADSMAEELVDWLNQDDSDWDAKQPSYQANGQVVAYPPRQVPDAVVAENRHFRITGSAVQRSLEQVVLSWNSESGFHYDIEVSNDMTRWDKILSNVTANASSTTRTISDPAIRNGKSRFYRVVLRP